MWAHFIQEEIRYLGDSVCFLRLHTGSDRARGEVHLHPTNWESVLFSIQ